MPDTINPLSRYARRLASMEVYSVRKRRLYYPRGRNDAHIVIEINKMAGRKPETQKLLIHTLFSEFERGLSFTQINVEITI